MKNQLLLIIIAAYTGLLLTSCSKLENISVSKRHYRSGFYVDLGSSKIKSTTTTPVETKSSANTAATKNDAEGKNDLTPSSMVHPSTLVSMVRKAEKKKQVLQPAASNVYAAKEIGAIKEDIRAQSLTNYVIPVSDAITNSPMQTSDSAPMWVIILFAFFIPPLGVALKFGIVDKFWISLVLTLLFWLPGAIYSLIVVSQ